MYLAAPKKRKGILDELGLANLPKESSRKRVHEGDDDEVPVKKSKTEELEETMKKISHIIVRNLPWKVCVWKKLTLGNKRRFEKDV